MSLSFETKPDSEIPSTFSQNSSSWSEMVRDCISALRQGCSQLPLTIWSDFLLPGGGETFFLWFLIHIKNECVFFYFSSPGLQTSAEALLPGTAGTRGECPQRPELLPPQSAPRPSAARPRHCRADKRLMFALSTI